VRADHFSDGLTKEGRGGHVELAGDAEHDRTVLVEHVNGEWGLTVGHGRLSDADLRTGAQLSHQPSPAQTAYEGYMDRTSFS
jgi:hypothetical protein